ncbi:MAG: hypothetical protein SFU84_11290 [Gemmatimonadales bacterium]|nr:hypothetical protein [Gemmatimonadales bacterium]
MIPYQQLLDAASPPAGAVDIVRFTIALRDAWRTDYGATSAHAPNLLEFEDHGFTFLYDQTSASGEPVEDRLVAGLGHSRAGTGRRPGSRIRGLLGGGLVIPGKGRFDKGHLLAHSAGGGTDVNLFPQNLTLNRGQSPAGRRYREMERYAATHPGTLVFSYLKYNDASWVPVALEYGLLKDGQELWVEEFANVDEGGCTVP